MRMRSGIQHLWIEVKSPFCDHRLTAHHFLSIVGQIKGCVWERSELSAGSEDRNGDSAENDSKFWTHRLEGTREEINTKRQSKCTDEATTHSWMWLQSQIQCSSSAVVTRDCGEAQSLKWSKMIWRQTAAICCVAMCDSALTHWCWCRGWWKWIRWNSSWSWEVFTRTWFLVR